MRLRVRSELLEIQPLDSVEKAHLEDAIAWVDSGASLFRISKPAMPPKHLVSYFAVIDSGNILLVDHKNAQLWLPTGGHVEPDEDPRITVVRELKEELGLEIALEAVGPPTMVTVTETVGLTSGHTDVSLWYVVQGDRAADERRAPRAPFVSRGSELGAHSC
jgi:8-oxo-dGTP pyrophosphatase MutT (NUDIX family)